MERAPGATSKVTPGRPALAPVDIEQSIDLLGVTGIYPLADAPSTGQALRHNASVTDIARTGTRQDGNLVRGFAWPNPRFTDNLDGTVTDNLSGLIWLKDANCFGPRTWEQALADINALASTQCGLTDGSTASQWRLPSVKELQSLIDFETYDPALPSGHPFSGVQTRGYWSSTTNASGTGIAWVQYLYGGYVYNDYKPDAHHVWPVRGG